MLFGPLTSVKTLEDVVASSANNADKGSSMSLFVSFGILTLLYVLSLSYYSDADYMYDDVHAGSTFDNIAQIPPQEDDM
jgi:hypothetical protein